MNTELLVRILKYLFFGLLFVELFGLLFGTTIIVGVYVVETYFFRLKATCDNCNKEFTIPKNQRVVKCPRCADVYERWEKRGKHQKKLT